MQLATVTRELSAAATQLTDENLDRTIKAIESHDRIFVHGTGRTGLMMKAFAMRLMQLGYHAYVVGETTTPSVAEGDLVFVASASGETGSVVSAASSALKARADLFTISAHSDSSLAHLHAPDVVIPSGTKYEESTASVQPLGSLFEQMILLYFDALVLRIVQSRKGANNEMASRHATIE